MAIRKVKDLMTRNPVTLDAKSSVVEAAKHMRDVAVGDVLVTDDGKMCGIVTDRDLVVRCLAEGKNPSQVKLGEICSRRLNLLTTSSSVGDAIKMMRDHAVRRLPVVENDRPVGVISIGDLAMERDKQSALAEISAAPANR